MTDYNTLPGKRTTLEMQWEQTRRTVYEYEFAPLAIPAPGQAIEIDAERVFGMKGPHPRFALRKIGRYEQAHPLPHLTLLAPVQKQALQSKHADCLALVFELKPEAGHSTGFYVNCFYVNPFGERGIRDDQGRVLTPLDGIEHDLLRPRGRPQPAGRWFTYLLAPPSSKAKSLQWRMRDQELTPTGRREYVVLRDLPLPAIIQTAP